MVHIDLHLENPEHPFAMASKTRLIGCDPEMGPHELWLGTLDTNLDYHRELGEPMIAPKKLEDMKILRPLLFQA